MIADLLGLTGEVVTWSADKLLAPVLTGVFVGVALRAVSIGGEVNEHDARADELNFDLSRWVRDRDRQLGAEIARAQGFARQGIIEDSVDPPLPRELEGTSPGSQENSSAFISRVERLMQNALHQYRDEASRKARIYRSMARGEGAFHARIRRKRSRGEPAPLAVSGEGRDLLQTWRERHLNVHGRPQARVGDDPTKHKDAADIWPLETEAGLTWERAGQRPDEA